MTTTHPELEAEQAYVDHAYDRLDEIRAEAKRRAEAHGRERGPTLAGVYERDVAVRVALYRAESLDVGDESLCFGRTDDETGERHYIGRRAIFDVEHHPLVIDWRVPAAEPFYRATGRHALGLVMRRHFLCEGRRLLAIEDERFAEGERAGLGLAGTGALLAALERPRSGLMRDIVGTIQAEQDEVIRAPLEGVLAVQGGPGTGKTAVALHRAAYLLFTHRRKLGQQGILVVGPNRHFLRYIEQVLPALGESGAHLVTPAELVPDARVEAAEPAEVARVKGDARMARVIARAVRDREQPLASDVAIGFEGERLTLSARHSATLVRSARRNHRSHNARHSMLASIVVRDLYEQYAKTVERRHGDLAGLATTGRREATRSLRAHPEVRGALDEMWPLLSPERLVGELLASRERLVRAARGILRAHEIELLHREDGAAWTPADVALLDEAFTALGAPRARRRTEEEDADIDEVETYGHVIADEVQDLSPMALRMLARRSRTGSMTVVGDLAQAVGALRPGSWNEILAQLPARRGQAVRELSINYRTPGAIADVAARVLAAAAPGLRPPRSVREGGHPIAFVRDDPERAVATLAREHRARAVGTMLVTGPASRLEALARAADASDELVAAVTVLGVEDAKGLEFDHVVIAEPVELIDDAPQGLRALYVALTRATQKLTVVHRGPLPDALTER